MRTRLALGLLLTTIVGSAQEAGAAPVRGGTIAVVSDSDVDYLDPGRTYYTGGYQVVMAVHRPLYGVFPGSPAAQPDLAAAAPEVSPDQRTVTVRLRPGVRFGPPLTRAVEAKDVKYAIERTFSTNVGGQYSTAFLSDLVGAPSRLRRGVKAIRGIEAPDPLTLVFRLSRPTAGAFAAALVLPATAPVPEEVAGKYDAKRVSTYNAHTVASGPYLVGSYRAGRSIVLERNPNSDPATDPRPAYADRITIKTNATKTPAGIGRAVAKASGQLAGVPVGTSVRFPAAQRETVGTGGTRYLALNARRGPFKSIRVRRAVMSGIDRVALRRTRGGAASGLLASHFLPPGTQGYAESGGEQGTGAPELARPRGNRAAARRALRSVRGRRVVVVGATVAPGRATAVEAARQLRGLGFRVSLKLVPQDEVYTEYCQTGKFDVCANVGWFRDFDDPSNLLEPLFGSAFARVPATNLGGLRSRSIDGAIRAAAELPPGPARIAAWVAINRRVVRLATSIPFVWDSATLVASKDVEAPVNPSYALHDLAFAGRR